MTIQEFQTETQRLEKFYEKTLDEAQLEIYYNGLRNVPVAKYKEMISSSFRIFKYFPKLSELVDLSNKMKGNYTQTKPQEIKVKCKYCLGSGLIRYYKNIDGIKYDFLAKCVCRNAENYSNFDLPSARELHLLEGE